MCSSLSLIPGSKVKRRKKVNSTNAYLPDFIPGSGDVSVKQSRHKSLLWILYSFVGCGGGRQQIRELYGISESNKYWGKLAKEWADEV